MAAILGQDIQSRAVNPHFDEPHSHVCRGVYRARNGHARGAFAEVAEGGAQRSPLGDRYADRPEGLGVDRAKHALGRLLGIDDVGTGFHGDPRLVGVAYAYEKPHDALSYPEPAKSPMMTIAPSPLSRDS